MRFLGKPACGNGAGEDLSLGAAAIGTKGEARDKVPKARGFQAQARGIDEIGGGDADRDAVGAQGREKVARAGNFDGGQCAAGESRFKMRKIGAGEVVHLRRRGRAAEMALKHLGHDVMVIADAVTVPIARQAGEAVQLQKRVKERILFGRCQIEQHAVDIEDDSGVSACSLHHARRHFDEGGAIGRQARA